MYQNRSIIDATATANGGNAFASYFYWSSTEVSASSAWEQHFNDGSQFGSGKDDLSRVRAVRAF